MSEQDKSVTLTRPYVIETKDALIIIRACSPSQALNHVMKGAYKARLATVDDVEDYFTQGGTVEVATIAEGQKTRLYVVETEESMSMIRAPSLSRALNHVVKHDSYSVRIASGDDVESYMSQGGVVEKAGEVITEVE